MSYRYGNDGYTRRPVRAPSAVSLMTAFLITFVVLSLIVLFAGALPIQPSAVPIQGPNYREYVGDDRALLSSYGYTLEGRVHLPIDRRWN
ncbi:MAG: hypothetical protein HC822_05590 [Oscillochloris sp.]|nr:hypothetical protein [Oscillochloris sp.]